jgi:O-antigen/teichoic acid export membrane protein
VVGRTATTVPEEMVAACALYVFANTLLKFSSLAIFRCVERVDVAACFSMAGAVLKLSVLAVVLTQGLHGAVPVLLLAAPSLLVAGLQALAARRQLRRFLGRPVERSLPPFELRRENRARQLKLLAANYVAGFTEIGHRELDVQILAMTSGLEAAGGYRLAKSIAMIVLEALNPVVMLLLPEFARRGANRPDAGLREFTRLVSRRLTLLAACSAAVVALGAKLYFDRVAPGQAGVWGVVVVLAAGFAATAPTLWAQAFLVANGRSSAYLRCSAGGALLAAFACLALSTPLGGFGAALGHVSGLLLVNWLAYRIATRLLTKVGGC